MRGSSEESPRQKGDLVSKVTETDNPTEITAADIFEVIRTLKSNNALTTLDNIEGADKFGTGPIRASYLALCSTQLIGNLDAVAGFLHADNYPDPNKALPSEYGSIANLRYLVSSLGSVTTGASVLGADVYNIFCCGMESYAIIDQDGYSAQFIYRPPILDGPLALNCTLGYKFASVCRITNDNWVINHRCTLI